MDNIAISGAQPGTEAQALGGQVMPPEDVITREQLQEFSRVLHEYKVGKASTERRMIAAEQWWKLHNQPEEEKAGNQMYRGFRSRSSWLHNVIVNKHADAVESYPEPNILPREEGDKQEAKMLSAIVPCVLEQNAFDATWSDAMWAKMKYGTCVYKITWDSGKLGGLGLVAVLDRDDDAGAGAGRLELVASRDQTLHHRLVEGGRNAQDLAGGLHLGAEHRVNAVQL